MEPEPGPACGANIGWHGCGCLGWGRTKAWDKNLQVHHLWPCGRSPYAVLNLIGRSLEELHFGFPVLRVIKAWMGEILYFWSFNKYTFVNFSQCWWNNSGWNKINVTSANICGKGWWTRRRILSLAVPGRSCGTWGSSIFVASCRVFFFLGVAFGTFSCGIWDLVLWPGMEPGPPALGVLSLSHWTTRKDPGKGEDSTAQNGV